MADGNCWLQDVNVRKQLEDYFKDVDRNFSRYYENNAQTAEPQLDGHLAARLESEEISSLQTHLERIAQQRRAAGMKPIRLSFKVTHITNNERKHGADIGLIARVELPGEYQLTKAALIQSKRLYPSLGVFSGESAYEEMFKNQRDPQWERMLNITPASVYFLYNPHQVRLKKNFQELGTKIISAQQIAGFAEASSRKRFTALDAHKRGKSLSKWMVDDFICCKLGDTRQDVVKTALGQNPDFPVSYTVQMMIQSDGTDLELWDQQEYQQE